MRVGAIVLPEHGWARTRETWRRLEEMGLDHAWTFDHHSWRDLRDSPWYDAISTLTAVAATTGTIRIGTMVSTPNFRHPAVLAKQVMTLDEISGGRFVLGIGAGALGADSGLLGGPELSPATRADRFAEFVELSDRLLRSPATTFSGSFYEVVDARMVPGCVQRPRVPFAIAATGARGLDLVATHARTWVTIGDARRPGERTDTESRQVLRRQLSLLAEACEKRNRELGSVGKLVNLSRAFEAPFASPARFADLLGTCAELGFTDVVVNHPRPSGVFAGDVTAFERAVLSTR
ncbi:LLM class flavin-dependent oxidoreductase [Lentzea cavernae]|uniref:Luciferase n=1 Tax=Lentzea cavernae TaxID=2020703 RepID=A0ABQ3MM38_9PSEU|nr:LLM class flavin-dependent oxidoreductase [Lentzea cavernae]GHH43368.1 luciferase [Lentzea cavernae]